MGLFDDAKKRYSEAKEKADRKNQFVCPECGGIMKMIVVQLGGSFRKARVKCSGCGMVMPLNEARETLDHPS